MIGQTTAGGSTACPSPSGELLDYLVTVHTMVTCSCLLKSRKI